MKKIIKNVKKTRCNESKNGILRGLVHQLGYSEGIDGKDVFKKIMNSGYLEIQFKDYDYNSGIFTRVLGKGDSIDDLYGEGIFLILSLSVLDDFDYWISKDMNFGQRKNTSFYKGICFDCKGKSKPLKDFSSAELGYLSLDDKVYHELVIPSDINIERYVEAIYVSDINIFDELIQDENLELWIKSRLINKEDLEKVYRKNCTGPEPESLNSKKYEKIKSLVKTVKLNNDIKKVNYKSINLKRMISLEYKKEIYKT